ncbi:glucosaminidase domain-containing protein [Magnetovibrio sp.]|uniref:glucosaminidase domain-containing protein n=1 Tax=Magnetovibrio sp. TaxID=2024836 RepID=UPI002F942780
MIQLSNPRRIPWLGIAVVVVLLGVLVGSVFWWRTAHRAPDLDIQIATARAALERARQQRAIDFSADDITVAPYESDAFEDRKVLFLAKILPLVAAENERILAQREIVKRSSSSAQLNALALVYGLQPGSVRKENLLRRIDVLPPSLVLAQAAIESAWGTSRFAREGNALFGERTYDPDTPGITPKRATGFKVKSFTSLQGSVRSYMRTLNAHRAYRALRERRAAVRALGQPLSGPVLAAHLRAYSELGNDYIDMIMDTIAANRLDEFDHLLAITPTRQ